MTVPRPKRATPGGFAYAGHPAGALWAVLVIGLLMALPCSGTARAATAGSPVQAAAAPVEAAAAPARAALEHSSRERVQHPHSTAAAAAARQSSSPLSWCSADDPGPRPGDGCSGHRFSDQDAQLPNAPPQPVPAALPQLVPAGALPQAGLSSARPGAVAAPDLHLLQVNRT